MGYGQVHERVRTDERVVVMERTNLRHMPGLPEPVTLATLDLSFISVIKVTPRRRTFSSGAGEAEVSQSVMGPLQLSGCASHPPGGCHGGG